MKGGGLGKEKKETKAGLLLSRQTAGLRLGKVCNAQRYRLEKETDRQKNNKTKSKQTLKNATGGIKRTTNIFSLWDRQCRDRSGVTQSVRECGKPVPLVGKRALSTLSQIGCTFLNIVQEKKNRRSQNSTKVGEAAREKGPVVLFICFGLEEATVYTQRRHIARQNTHFTLFVLFFSNSPNQPTGVDSVTSLQLPHTPQSSAIHIYIFFFVPHHPRLQATIITTAIPLLVPYQNGDHA
ncbi:hypothetical protein T12_16439 [Trichinella patagoniensis]|uniref:Uncharacterized protein n=1 Tax=Trichinella patagoniensis TaxID=990121 RepID=A0A0V1AEB6_9BILA|nr:hypothetical protein T12_16439 [Trichinella patagoniensis]